MSDVCLCTGNCPVNEYCYRYTLKDDNNENTYSMLEEVCIPNGYSEMVLDENRIKKEDKAEELKKMNYVLESLLLEELILDEIYNQ